MVMSKEDIQKAEYYYPELDFKKLVNYAIGWGKDYPLIEKIEIYRGGRSSGSIGYILVATVPNPAAIQTINGNRVFKIKYKDINIEGIERLFKREFDNAIIQYPELRYYKWASNSSCAHIHEDLGFIIKCDPDNKIKKAQFIFEWQWYQIEPGQDILKPNNRSNDFVEDNTGIVLYEQESKAQVNNTSSVFSQNRFIHSFSNDNTSANPVLATNNESEKNENNPQAKQEFVISKKSDLQWNDITVFVVSDFELRFHPKGKTAITREYKDLGFEDKRSSNPVQAWTILIEALRQNRGEIPYHLNNKKKIEKIAQELRKKIKGLFPNIKGNPILFDKSNNSYQISLKISPR